MVTITDVQTYDAPPVTYIPGGFTAESSKNRWGGGTWSAGYNGLKYEFDSPPTEYTFDTKFTLFNHLTITTLIDRAVYFFDAYTAEGNQICTIQNHRGTMYVYDGPQPATVLDVRDYSVDIGTMVTGVKYTVKLLLSGGAWSIYVNGVLKRTLSTAPYRGDRLGAVILSGRNITNSNSHSETANDFTDITFQSTAEATKAGRSSHYSAGASIPGGISCGRGKRRR